MSDSLNPSRRDLARKLRRNMTIPEKLLWGELRDRRLSGHKFVRQFQIGGFIVDFVCREFSLAIELDGDSHNERGDADHKRQQSIESLGFEVIRFSNDDVITQLDAVIEGIVEAINRISAQRGRC